MTCSTSEVAVCCSNEFAQLVEQPGVLDGDDRLRGEILDQLDLLVAERAHLLTVDAERPDQHFFLEHRHDKKGPCARDIGNGNGRRIALEVSLVRREVGNVLHLFCFRGESKAVIRAWAKRRFEATLLGPCRRGTVHRYHPEVISFVKEQRTELRLADTRRILQHGPEHRFQFPRRARDDLEHVGGRGLLLQRIRAAR